MDFEGFLLNQERIYGHFQSAMREMNTRGAEIDPGLLSHRGCFSIALTHPAKIAFTASNLSKMMATVIPSVVYDVEDIHTTLLTFKLQSNFYFDQTDSEQQKILDDLSASVEDVFSAEKITPCKIDYRYYLYNSHVVIAAGVPDKAFVRLIDLLHDACAARKMKMSTAWGAHMTLGRFTESVPPKKMSKFFHLIENANDIGESVAAGVSVGYTHWDKPKSPLSFSEYRGHFKTYKHYVLTQ